MPNLYPLVIVVSCHRLKFLGPYCEEGRRRLGRGLQGWYYEPLVLALPVLTGGGPDD